MSKPLDEAIGRRIRAAREKAGLTKTAVAAAVGRHLSQIGRWESGQQPLELDGLFRVARALGRKASSLIKGLELPK